VRQAKAAQAEAKAEAKAVEAEAKAAQAEAKAAEAEAKAAQAGSGEQQTRPAFAKRLEGPDMALIQGLDAKHEHMGTPRLDDDGPTCAHFSEGALDRDLG